MPRDGGRFRASVTASHAKGGVPVGGVVCGSLFDLMFKCQAVPIAEFQSEAQLVAQLMGGGHDHHDGL